jgi:hypothetical protein
MQTTAIGPIPPLRDDDVRRLDASGQTCGVVEWPDLVDRVADRSLRPPVHASAVMFAPLEHPYKPAHGYEHHTAVRSRLDRPTLVALLVAWRAPSGLATS